MDYSIDHKFVNLLLHKINSNFNLIESGSEKNIPVPVVVPESTFMNLGLDRQDMVEMIKKFQFLGLILEYKIFPDFESTDGIQMDEFEWKAYEFFRDTDSKTHETVYFLLLNEALVESTHNKLFKNEGRKIRYNPITGVGLLRGKDFKFKDQQPEYFLFKDLYENYNRPVKKEVILKILKHSDSTAGTLAINDLVKKIRARTGLKPNELVLNNGNITLSI